MCSPFTFFDQMQRPISNQCESDQLIQLGSLRLLLSLSAPCVQQSPPTVVKPQTALIITKTLMESGGLAAPGICSRRPSRLSTQPEWTSDLLQQMCFNVFMNG